MTRSSALLCAGVGILAVQAVASLVFHRQPFLPSPPPLVLLPMHLGDWQQVQDASLDPEVLEALSPSDSLDRQYRLDSGQAADLFVAYYKSQLQTKGAHDPKVCLPGAGWNPRESRLIDVSVPGSNRSFPVNDYRIAKDGAEEIVLYWFQTYNGVYTFEQQLKAHRVLDAIAANRTDMALVRIVVPVDADGVDVATQRATQLAQLVYPQMLPYFPAKEKPGS